MMHYSRLLSLRDVDLLLTLTVKHKTYGVVDYGQPVSMKGEKVSHPVRGFQSLLTVLPGKHL